MNIQCFKYVIEIEKAGSISQAATNLYMAQPNLSKTIKDMESELGYSIFRRTAGGIKVTDKGEEFIYHARKVLEQVEEIEKIASKADDNSNRFKISIPRGSYIANGYTALVEEIANLEHLEVTINETNASKTIQNVADYGYNMGIIRYQKDEEENFNTLLRNHHLKSEIIWEFEYLLVMSREHPLAALDTIRPEDLEGYIKITHGDITSPHEKMIEATKKKKKQDDKIIYVYERGSQFDLLANVPTTYMWVSPIPESILERQGLVQRACRHVHNKYKDVLIYRDDYELGDIDKLFQKKIYESKVEVASSNYC
ncbi:MAG: LysR family transcriptional regulator [Butyrivibrio sp.]|nr:LysR family transcriptional regulator [Butyrivibrio sp.]